MCVYKEDKIKIEERVFIAHCSVSIYPAMSVISETTASPQQLADRAKLLVVCVADWTIVKGVATTPTGQTNCQSIISTNMSLEADRQRERERRGMENNVRCV